MREVKTVTVTVKEVLVYCRDTVTGEFSTFRFISPSKRVSLGECQDQLQEPLKAMDFDVHQTKVEIPFDTIQQFID